jgi:hypothetical protein
VRMGRALRVGLGTCPTRPLRDSFKPLKAFRHPYPDITAPALAIFALGDPLAGA